LLDSLKTCMLPYNMDFLGNGAKDSLMYTSAIRIGEEGEGVALFLDISWVLELGKLSRFCITKVFFRVVWWNFCFGKLLRFCITKLF
jgi:hypothetical protein